MGSRGERKRKEKKRVQLTFQTGDVFFSTLRFLSHRPSGEQRPFFWREEEEYFLSQGGRRQKSQPGKKRKKWPKAIFRVEDRRAYLPSPHLDTRQREREYQSVPQIEIVQPYTVEYCLFFWKFDSGPAEHEFSGIAFPLLLL